MEKTCADYRSINLMNHLLKVFLKVRKGRIYNKCKEYLSETQFASSKQEKLSVKKRKTQSTLF